MAFPSVRQARSWPSPQVNNLQLPIDLPTSIVAGETLVCIVSADTAQDLTADATLSPGWTRIDQQLNGAIVTGAVFTKVAAGGETRLYVNMTTADRGSAVSYAITGGFGVSLSSSIGNSTNPDPPSHTPPDGIQDYLWIAARSGDADILTTVAPSGYTDLRNPASGPQGATTAAAYRTNRATSEDPGAFTCATEQYIAWTIAVSPQSPRQVTINMTCVVNVTGKVIRKRSVSVVITSDADVTGLKCKQRAVSVAIASNLNVKRYQIDKSAFQDSSGSPLIDSSGNSIDGNDAAVAQRAVVVTSLMIVNVRPASTMRRSVSVVAQSTCNIGRIIIRKRSVAVAAQSACTVTYKKTIKARVSVVIQSVANVGYTAAGVSPRQASVVIQSNCTIVGKIIRKRAASVVTQATCTVGRKIIFNRNIAMFPAVTVIVARKVTNNRAVSCLIQSGCTVRPAVTCRRAVSVTASLTAQVFQRKIILESVQISAQLTASISSRKVSTRPVSVQASLNMSATGTVFPSSRRRLSSPEQSGSTGTIGRG